MLALANDAESKSFQSPDNLGLGGVDGEFGHYTAIRVSATNTSRIGASVPSTSGPKLST